jgi:IS5 family transposase
LDSNFIKEDWDFGLIWVLQTTTASVHDCRVNLSEEEEEEEEVVYRHRGYFSAEPKGFDATMQRGVRGHPIDIRDILRYNRILRFDLPTTDPMPSSRICFMTLRFT